MKIADLLKRVAAAVEQAENPARPDADIQNPAELAPINTGVAVDAPAPDEAEAAESDVMIPPLQLKTELLKRAVGVDNVYDEDGPRADQAHDTAGDEIAQLKQRAGIPVAAVMELDNEELTDD